MTTRLVIRLVFKCSKSLVEVFTGTLREKFIAHGAKEVRRKLGYTESWCQPPRLPAGSSGGSKPLGLPISGSGSWSRRRKHCERRQQGPGSSGPLSFTR